MASAWLSQFRKKWDAAVPVILFYLFLFYTVIAIFGIHYVMAVSFITTLFKIRHLRPFHLRSAGNTVLVLLALTVLAFFATLSLPLCLLLNFAVPFLLVCLQSTQFNQKGYFSYAMCFVFLQLRPVGWEGFATEFAVVLYSCAILVAGLALYARFRQKPQDFGQARRGLGLLAGEFRRLAQGQRGGDTQGSLFDVESALHKLAYSSRGMTQVVRGDGRIHYMFALLFQRSAYFISDSGYLPESPSQSAYLTDAAALLDAVQSGMNRTDNGALIARAAALQAGLPPTSERLSTFLRHFYDLLMLILQQLTDTKAPDRGAWKLPPYLRTLRGLPYRLHLDAFEVRFALRLSLITTIGFAVCQVTDIEHSYWLPLNAFLLLQPMYEESAQRMKTRLVGTALGCLLVFVCLPLLPGTTGHFVFATVLISLMYCCTPGTWVQPIFSTGFALTLASLSIGSTTAIELRFLYLILATVLVLAVNRFVFRTSLPGQFRINLTELFHLQTGYLSLLEQCAQHDIDYSVLCEELTRFHLIYDQVAQYLSKQPPGPVVSFNRDLLRLMWRLAAQAEQLIFLARSTRPGEDDLQSLVLFAREMQRCLYVLLSGRLPAADALEKFCPPPHQDGLRHLMERYDDTLRALCALIAARPGAAAAHA